MSNSLIIVESPTKIKTIKMNDRCAAGAGKFLEIMAHILEAKVAELGNLALSASKTVQIKSLFTVFAGSEVVIRNKWALSLFSWSRISTQFHRS